MKRTFNFTGRKSIPPSHYSLRLESRNGARILYSQILNLSALHLKQGSKVRLKTLFKGRKTNINYGIVSAYFNPDAKETKLDILKGDTHGEISCRWEIVEAVSDGSVPKILAASKYVRIRYAESEDEKNSLLPVDIQDLGNTPWRIQYSELSDQYPILILNSKLNAIEISEQLKKVSTYSAMIIPIAMSMILEKVLIEDGESDNEDDHWHNSWIRFAQKFNYDPLPPKEDKISRREWVEDVISKYSEGHKFVDTILELAGGHK
jgi:hypothetical protein